MSHPEFLSDRWCRKKKVKPEKWGLGKKALLGYTKRKQQK
jgi:hypothetical protein